MLQTIEDIGIVNLIVGAIVTTLTGVSLNRFIKFTKEVTGQNKAIKDATVSSLRYNIVEAHYNYTRCGKINKYALESVEEQYKAYHTLGGNGFIENVVKEIRALPIE